VQDFSYILKTSPFRIGREARDSRFLALASRGLITYFNLLWRESRASSDFLP